MCADVIDAENVGMIEEKNQNDREAVSVMRCSPSENLGRSNHDPYKESFLTFTSIALGSLSRS